MPKTTPAKTTTTVPSRPARLWLWGLLGFGVASFLAFRLTGLAGDEEAAHYMIARYAPGQLSLFLSLVGRPLVTLGLVLPAQAGFLASRLASAIATGIAVWGTARLLLRTGWLPPWWGLALLFLQPFFTAHAATAMTEPWMAALMAWALVFLIEKKWLFLTILAGLAPFARLEQVVFWPLIAWLLHRNGRARYAWLLLIPLPLWNFLGTLATGDFLWLLHQTEWRPYPERPPWHYLQCFEWILGAGLLPVVIVGLVQAVKTTIRPEKPRKDEAALGEDRKTALQASATIILVFLAVYTTLAWWRPITFGNLRYFASSAPVFVILAAAGIRAAETSNRLALLGLFLALLGTLLVWNRFLYQDFSILTKINILPAVASGLILILHLVPPGRPFIRYAVLALALASLVRDYRGTLHLNPTSEQAAVADVVARSQKNIPKGAVIYSAHPLLPFYLNRNPYDRDAFPAVTSQSIPAAPAGAFLFWETHYIPGRSGSISALALTNSSDWEYAGAGVASDTVWAGGFFRRAGPTGTVLGPLDTSTSPSTETWIPAVRLAQAGIPRALEVARLDPNNDNWWRSLGRRYRLANMPALGLEAFKRAERLDPYDADNDLFRAEYFRDAGRYDEAYQMARQGLSKEPRNGEMNLMAGLVLLDLRRPGEARPYLVRAVARMPRRADVQYVIGRMYADTGQWSEAWPYFQKVLELNPAHKDGRLYAVESALQLRLLDQAEKLLLEIIRREPKAASGYTMLADFYIRREQMDDARRVLRTGLEESGGDTTIAKRLREMPSSRGGTRLPAGTKDNPADSSGKR